MILCKYSFKLPISDRISGLIRIAGIVKIFKKNWSLMLLKLLSCCSKIRIVKTEQYANTKNHVVGSDNGYLNIYVCAGCSKKFPHR